MNPKKAIIRKKAASATTICALHHELVDSISEIKNSHNLVQQTLEQSVVPLLQKHDKLLYGGEDIKKGLMWKWESNSIKISVLIFVLTAIVGYFSGNNFFPTTIKTILKALGLL